MKKLLGFILILMLLFTFAVAESEEFVPLQNGSSGEEVAKAQEQLKILGFLTGAADGSFGPGTENAVRAFQVKNGLEEDGILDQDDLTCLYSLDVKGESDDYEYRNLLFYSTEPVYAGPGNPSNYAEGIWREASGGTGTREVVDVDAPVAGVSKGFHITGTADCASRTHVAVDGVPLTFGETYTLSCFAKGSGRIYLQHGKTSWLFKVYAVSEDWQQYSYTFTVGINDGSTAENPSVSVYFGVDSNVDSDITICGMKLEKVRPTEWVANPADSIRARTLPAVDVPEEAVEEEIAEEEASEENAEEEVPAEAVEDEAVEEEDPSLLRNGSSGEDVAQAQQQLKILGFLTGSTDGFFGSNTENAVRAFQARNGLEENGALSQDDLARLYSIGARGASDDYEYRNLLFYSADPVYAGPGNLSNYAEGIWRQASGGTGTREVLDVNSPVAGISKGFHITGTADCASFTDVAIDGISLTYGESYTLSCFARGSGQLHLQHGKTSWISRFYTVSEDWQQYSYTFTVGINDGSSAEDPSVSIYYGVNANVDSDITICGLKLEKVRPTEGVANPADGIRTRSLPSEAVPEEVIEEEITVKEEPVEEDETIEENDTAVEDDIVEDIPLE